MTMAAALAVALLCGIVLQHHHHDADGSMCLAVACHDCLCHHQHDAPACDGHDCPGCGDGCSMHLDSFCCGQQDYAAVPVVHDMLLCDAFVADLSAAVRLTSVKVMYARPTARAVTAGFRSMRDLRAPPADNLC